MSSTEFRAPRIIHADHINLPRTSNATNDPSRPRYIPRISANTLSLPSLSSGSHATPSSQSSNYCLSTEHSPLNGRKNPSPSTSENTSAEPRGTVAAPGSDQITGPSAHLLSRSRSSSGPENHSEEEDLQASRESLDFLFERLRVDRASPAALSLPLQSLGGATQRVGNQSANSSRSNRHKRNQGERTGRHRDVNESNRRSPSGGNDNHSDDKPSGDRGEDSHSPREGSSPANDLFACPFHKFDPVRFAGCHDVKLKDIDSVWRVSFAQVHGNSVFDLTHR